MQSLTRLLLVAPYGMLAMQRVFDTLPSAAGTARDHSASAILLLCLLVIVAALVLRRSPVWLLWVAVVLNLLLAVACVVALGGFLSGPDRSPGTIKELLDHAYFMILVPIVAIRYLLMQARPEVRPC